MWRTRWVTTGFLVAATALLPWIVVLALTLPAGHHDRNYAPAWAGFDALLAASLAATGWLARRRDSRAGLTAAATAALAVVDAWFDVMTALPGQELGTAVAMAVLGELPLAALCVAVALSTSRRTHVVLARRPEPHRERAAA